MDLRLPLLNLRLGFECAGEGELGVSGSGDLSRGEGGLCFRKRSWNVNPASRLKTSSKLNL